MTTENQPIQLPEPPGHIPKNAESSFEIPQASVEFRTLPNDSAAFGKVPQIVERKETHTLTVRETARMFEAMGVARTERSIINWCQVNRQGITRLDSYYDPNERKYFITPQSVEAVIQEEIQRANKSSEASISEPFGSPVAHVKHFTTEKTMPPVDQRVQELEREVQNLNIANEVKDKFIELMKKERNGFIDKLITANRAMGQLETKLNQLDRPQS